LLSFHQLTQDEPRIDRANRVCAIREMWLEVFAISTVFHIHHGSPARHASSEEAQNGRDQKGDKTFTQLHGYGVDLFLRVLQVIGTHNGTFHCDEALAVYMLRQTSTYADAGLLRRPVAALSTAETPIG